MSLRYLVDSDWVIHWLDGHEKIRRRLHDVKEEGLALWVISLAELYEGVYYGRNRRAAEEGLRDLQETVKHAQAAGVVSPTEVNRWLNHLVEAPGGEVLCCLHSFLCQWSEAVTSPRQQLPGFFFGPGSEVELLRASATSRWWEEAVNRTEGARFTF